MSLPSAAAKREAWFNRLATETFDVLVVGGGINGCGIARDAALRGFKVALVEKNDFASGTSGRSSRLIHGGIRYLEHGYLHLVFEATRERRILLRTAPTLVRPLEFTWPVYHRDRISRLMLELGLTAYELLAMFRNSGRHERLTRSELLRRQPALRREGLRGGARYLDAITDDARLVLANALAADRSGAVVMNHAAAIEIGAHHGVTRVVDTITQRECDVRARCRVRALGPWHPTLRGTKGAHIAVPAERVRINGAVAFLSPADQPVINPGDQRVMFLIPSGSSTIVGTTDTPTSEGPDDVRANEREVGYLLDSANAVLEGTPLTRADVVNAWAAIRPLAPGALGGDAGSASREHHVARDGSEIIVTGGKLTTYRRIAAETVDAVERVLKRAHRPADTSRLPLQAPGGENLAHGIEHELACTLGDLLIRRAPIAFQERDNGRALAPKVAAEVAPLLGWDNRRVAEELTRYEAEVARIFSIEPTATGHTTS